MNKQDLKCYLCDEIAFQYGIYGVMDDNGDFFIETANAETATEMVDSTIAYLCENGIPNYDTNEYEDVTLDDFSDIRDEVINMVENVLKTGQFAF